MKEIVCNIIYEIFKIKTRNNNLFDTNAVKKMNEC
jgi:hypothetical protein